MAFGPKLALADGNQRLRRAPYRANSEHFFLDHIDPGIRADKEQRHPVYGLLGLQFHAGTKKAGR